MYVCTTKNSNDHDNDAVAVMKKDTVVGYVPREFLPILWYLLNRDGVISIETIGKRVFGKGQEVPCTFTVPKKIIEKLQKLLSDVH